ncbi:MAG: class I SAM-dependent methyltransferase [Bryobacteraceae bacterium]|jgi:SAM-dependent methyltransferase
MTAATVEAPAPYQFKPGPYSSHALLLREFPRQGAGRRVLDIGCAGGYLAEILAQRGFSVTGIDLPGTPHPSGIHFVAADLDRGLPVLDASFDYIVCADVLEHLRQPERLLRECRERLAPGGALIASLPNSGHAYFRGQVLMGRFPQHDRGLFDRTHVQFYMWHGWVDLLARAGFLIETLHCSGVPVGLALPKWEGSVWVRALERLSYESARVWKNLFAYQFIVRARAERMT